MPTMDTIISLCKRRGFIMPGSEIYGGLANSWDYGPLGVELKNNIKAEWWKRFVQQRADMVGIDAASIMNPKVWEASGHTTEFTDPLVECKKCHNRMRADQLEGVCPSCGGKEFTGARQFNLLFKTFLGSVEDAQSQVYLRGELAQALFVNFKNVLETTRRKLPFGIASQGKVFRNEITPGNFIFRTREFDLMELEYFVKAHEWERWFEHWHKEMHAWLAHCGVKEAHIFDHEIPDGERAHYSKRTIDIEYEYPFGRKELYGLAYRTDFDLKCHMALSGEDLSYHDTETKESFVPQVIEPSFGLDRTVLVALLEAYHEEEAPTAEKGETALRVVLKLPKWMAPVKVAVLPLSKKESLSLKSREVFEMLLPHFVAHYDETQSIGKRYRRQDEIGTPFCVTIDFETLEDNAVTVRDRDTLVQKRISIEELVAYLTEALRT